MGEYAGERDMEEFWRQVEPRDEPVRRRWFLPAILILLVLSVPWYRPEGLVGTLYGGLPGWIWTALGCSFLVSVVTCFVCLRAWEDDRE